MARQRSVEIWHVPKRGSIHQILGALNVLKHFGIDGQTWPGTWRKKFDQKFAVWGFTTSGTSLSRNASETLEALLKYLGLVAIDDERRIRITQVGQELIKEFPIKEPAKRKRHLSETEKEIGDVFSIVLRKQMMKLILANPSISIYCKNVKVAPFRETLMLLMDPSVGYLTPEELAMFLFHMKDKAERSTIRKEILQFRSMDPKNKERMIEQYLETAEGNLTLKQAPTVVYWRELCRNTGLFEEKGVLLKLKNGVQNEVKELLSSYEDELYDFGNDLGLWHQYYTTLRTSQPIGVEFEITVENLSECLCAILKDNFMIKGAIVEAKTRLHVPAFPNEELRVEITDLETGNVIKSLTKRFTKGDQLLEVKARAEKGAKTDRDATRNKIEELISSKDVDPQYRRLLEIVGTHTGQDLLEKKNIAWLRGGRLECLFSKLLREIELGGIIAALNWNGHVNEYGISYPAPGLKQGLADIFFKCGNTYYLLELTTIKAPAAQWQAEGSSVPYHIRNFVDKTNVSKVVGVFCAPLIHSRVDDALKNTLIPYKFQIISVSVDDFLEAVFDASNFCNKLNTLVSIQYPPKP